MQINIEKNRKENKQHGNYSFPVHISPEAIQFYEQGSFMWHWHPEIELTWFISGQMEYCVNDQKYILSAGEGLFCNCNALHSGYMLDGQDCNYISVTFHPRFIYGYENSLIQTKFMDFITSNEAWASLKLDPKTPWQQNVLEQIQTIYQLSLDPPQDYELRIHMLLTSVWQNLYHYYSSIPSDVSPDPKHLDRLRSIMSYVQEHSMEDLCLDDIADHVNICKSECCRFFKKHMKMTIFDYLLSLRIQNSLPLLMSGESITKIADMVGFSTPAYYGQIFKRYMGCSPSQYRKNHLSS